MIPFQKIFTLIIRTFSKPMLGFLKQRQQENKMVALRWVFVGFGRRYHAFEHWLNHKILKTTHKAQLTELKQEILLEKGIEAVYELLFYSIVIGLPLYQLYTSAVSSHKKEEKLRNDISNLEKQLKSLNNNLASVLKQVEERNRERQSIQNEKKKRLAEIQERRQVERTKKQREYYKLKQEQQQIRLRQIMSEQNQGSKEIGNFQTENKQSSSQAQLNSSTKEV